jgi:hypothetical protein
MTSSIIAHHICSVILSGLLKVLLPFLWRICVEDTGAGGESERASARSSKSIGEQQGLQV